MLERARENEKISFILNTTVDQVVAGSTGSVEKLCLRNTVTGETSELETAAMFVAIGHDPRSELVRDQVEVDEDGYVLTGQTTATSIPGVFACGDLVDKRYRQAITAAGSGCSASIDAERWLAEQA